MQNYDFCLNPQRFDIPAKVLYIKHKELGFQFGLDVYLYHLKVVSNFFHESTWNGFKHEKTQKVGQDQFIKSFDNIIDAIKNDTFDWERSPLPVGGTDIITNGSHRAAACLYYNKPSVRKPAKKEYYIPYSTFQKCCQIHKVEPIKKYTDAIAIEYCRLKKSASKTNLQNLHMCIVYPKNKLAPIELIKIISKYSKIFYYKKFYLSGNGPLYFTKQLYPNEKWIGTYKNKFHGLRTYMTNSYGDSKNPVIAFLVESEKLQNMIDCKAEIRKICGIGNYSIHTTDTYKQCWDVANVCFNDNSIHLLNHMKYLDPSKFPNFLSIFNTYKSIANDNMCIDSSAVMSVYGLRDCNDIDFLHIGDLTKLVKEEKLIRSHNKYLPLYKENIYDIFYNHSFFYDGVRFCTLDLVKRMKKNRNEPKDIEDGRLF